MASKRHRPEFSFRLREKHKKGRSRIVQIKMDLLPACLLGLVLIIFCVCLVVHFILYYSFPVKGTTNLPQLRGIVKLPLFGHAWVTIGKSMTEIWKIIPKMLNLHSDCIAAVMWLGPKMMICSKTARLNEFILTNGKAKWKDMYMYAGFRYFVDGMFSRNGKGWSDLRRPLDKMLTPEVVKEKYTAVFEVKCELVCQALDKLCDQGIFDILSHAQSFNLDIIGETVLGILPGKAAEFRSNFPFLHPSLVNDGTEIVFRLITHPEYRFKWLLRFTKLQKQIDILREQTRRVGAALYDYRKNVLLANGQNPEDPEFEPECFTDVAMQVARKENIDGYNLTWDVIIGGFHTSAIALSSAFLFLAQHPEYQEKVYKEQVEIMGDSLKPPNPEEISRMTYLWMVYQETLRHVGPAAVFRVISSELEFEGYTFPEGATVYASLYGACMEPENWVKTKEFFPDNFLPEHVEKRPKGSFFPFSAGARGCPGKVFATLSGRMLLSTLLRRFKFSTNLEFKDMQWEYQLMVESALGYPVQITKRNPAL